MYLLVNHNKLAKLTTFIEFHSFQITIIIAPSLPLALSISIGYAIRRLKKHHIKVALPNSINVAGKVKLTVFDKTG